jgi:hypothetical protein
MDPHVREQVEAMQPRKGALLLLIPVAMVALVFALYAVALAFGLYGRPADGERVVLVASACPEARAVVAHRVNAMGLGDPVFDEVPGGFQLTVTLPAEADVAASIPVTLATPGRLRAVRESQPDVALIENAQITGAAIRQDLTLIPWTVITLAPEGYEALLAWVREQRDGKVVWSVDGEPIGTVSNLKGAATEVEISPALDDDRARMMRAAELAIVLDSGPLPCPVAFARR